MTKDDGLPGALNLAFLEELLERYRRDPSEVSESWRQVFEQCEGMSHSVGTPRLVRRGSVDPHPREKPNLALLRRAEALQDRVDQLIRSYRMRGHLIAKVDPLDRPLPNVPELDPAFYGLEEGDMERPFSCETIPGPPERTLGEILDHLRETYCRSIAIEYAHIHELLVRRWLRHRVEATRNHLALDRAAKVRILTRLTDAVLFEEFLRRRFIGAKSFSLEGAETLIPLLDLAIEKAGAEEVDEIVIAMAHRGRLNVLANILGKSLRQIFREFDDTEATIGESGDVKYHLGASTLWQTSAKRPVHLSLCFNPSHLEFVNSIALGRTRAKQDRVGDSKRRRAMTLLIHGDASFIAQGVVQECLVLSELKGYATGGTLHVIVNNQIGFTTAPNEARSSTYATDIARMLQVPIFHVNGEDPEAVAQAVDVALDFRQEFQRDVLIDMYCYRRLGHNETDDPTFTQPAMYKRIKERPSIREQYLERLLEPEIIERSNADEIATSRRALLEAELGAARNDDADLWRENDKEPSGLWAGFWGGPVSRLQEVETSVAEDQLVELLRAQMRLPPTFVSHPKLPRFFARREAMARGETPLDWSAAESLALASLAIQGARIRLSGQDAARGTFSQRHAVLHDYETGEPWTPLQHLSPDQAPVEILNSPLCEAGSLGFEYGYSLETPSALVLWEAQFGDFVNAAQVIIDQFLSSAEDKWHRLSGLVLLLPHGFEGEGPEHSSARLERFLSLAAEDNTQIIQPTLPAQFFHLLRRQALIRWRKPLVVLTPKSLLRLPQCVSPLGALASGRFEKVLPDPSAPPSGLPPRILLCSGKVFFELAAAREQRGEPKIPIVRVEQLYPFPDVELEDALGSYREETPVVWVQEEPENMGAWPWLRVRFLDRLQGRFPFSGVFRKSSASPASGSRSAHRAEQEMLLEEAFQIERPSNSPA